MAKFLSRIDHAVTNLEDEQAKTLEDPEVQLRSLQQDYSFVRSIGFPAEHQKQYTGPKLEPK